MQSQSSVPHETLEHRLADERRLTTVEVVVDSHRGKINYLERAVQGLIYVSTALAVGKSGELVEQLATILKLTR